MGDHSAHQGSAHAAGQGSGGHGHHEEVGHVVSVKLLVGVLVALILLTFLTVWTYYEVDVGFLNIWIAMGIASLKATLVVMFFMHLYWDTAFNKVVFVATLVFMTLFISFSLLDTREYLHTQDRGDSYDVQQKINKAQEEIARERAASAAPPTGTQPGGH